MTIEEGMAVLERGRLEAAYVVAGPNSFWRGVWLKKVQQIVLGEDPNQTGTVRLSEPADFAAVQLELAGAGLFAPFKLVVVDTPRWAKKEETVRRYLEHPAPESLLVIIEDKVSQTWEKAVGRHRVVEMTQLGAAGFRRFVREQSDLRGIRWAPGAFDAFCQAVAFNEHHAVQELEKARLWTPDQVSTADVAEMVVPIGGEDKPWDVTDALIGRDGPTLFRRIARHLSQGMAPLFLFIIMVRQVILLDQARRAAANGRSLAQFQREAGIKEFVARKVWQASKQWDRDRLQQLIEWAAKIDVAMKTGYGEPDVWLVFWAQLAAREKPPRL